ncbi:hypothetical protein KDX16_16645 [Burkholderia vietnamiensis]|uniref:Uncharacterized protein n=1 Tax=Burkholderia contaminans TaxID=488447 RepID=A0AAP4VLM6_9BURK|nr:MULTISPECIES: hypothetical protein [Burkholderia]HDR9756578.1 hypothetical protein [Burkholderia cepacia ATCC 25416]MBR7917416.1 hypothetical protein [Burkholderia vietnamiensis]MBR8054276.1 hypothetical protein [Burkholderia vietnamiensis]MDN7458450.1 hypothetical protein [Burkholderia cenocepacia]MDN7569925.1 hypothetical protein [Burkholderia contaminans]
MDLIELKKGGANVALQFRNGNRIDFTVGAPVGLNIVEGWREDPDGLMKLLQKGVPVFLEAEATRRASRLIAQLMLEKPRANLMDLYRTLHADPEFSAFANAMLQGFVPGRHAD